MLLAVLALLVASVGMALQVTLEVLRGAGAIWGCAEIFRLRAANMPEATEFWRSVAEFFGPK